MFIPQRMKSTFLLWSERDNGPVAYYVDTDSATESPVDAIDLQHMQSLTSTSYFPLVTVEIWPIVHPTSSWLDSTPTSIPCQSAATNPMSSTGGGGDNMPVFAAVGVAGTL